MGDSSEARGILGAIGVAISILALAVSGASAYFSFRAEAREEMQERLRVAAQVYLQEAPGFAYEAHPKKGNQVRWVVANFNRDPIDEVWVEGRDDTSVKMWHVPGCSLYALPNGFVPIAVNFVDVNGRWKRSVGASAPREGGSPMPASDTADSPWAMDLVSC